MPAPKREPFELILVLGAVVAAAIVSVVSYVYVYGRSLCGCGLSGESFRGVFVVTNARFRPVFSGLQKGRLWLFMVLIGIQCIYSETQ